MTLPSDTVPYFFFGPHKSNKTANEIMDFTRLPKGWHYGRGGPISKRVCTWALQLNGEALARGYRTTEAFPGVDGEVMVSAYIRNHTLDFTIYPDGHITYRREVDDEDVEYSDNLTLEAAKAKISVLGLFTWNLFASSTQGTLVKKRATSKTSPSSPAQTGEESQLSIEDVPWRELDLSVSTS
jgi:hypothetical protein